MVDLSSAFPTMRTSGLVSTTSGDEILIYDVGSHHIHHVNAVAARVMALCDGSRTIDAIVQVSGLPTASVHLALEQLTVAGLLDGEGAVRASAGRSSRRAFLRKAGVAGAAAMPAIVSVSAPAAAQGRSCTDPVFECSLESAGRNCCAASNCNDCGTCQQRESNGNWFCDH